MTKQQLLQASKLLMELADLFQVASNGVEESSVIAPLVEKPIETLLDKDLSVEPTVDPETSKSEEFAYKDLNEMTIQQLRAEAKSLNLSTKGTKKDLVARISEAMTSDLVQDEENENIAEMKVVEAEVVENVQEDAEELDDIEVEEEENLDPMEVIQAELEEMQVEELQEILESVDLPTKGKKQALISRILEAVEDGVLEFEEEIDENYNVDEEDEELDEVIEQALDNDEEESDDDYEVVEDEEIEEEDEEETNPREVTQNTIEEEILEAYEDGSLTDKTIAKFLDEYFNGKFKPLNKKRALNKYIEIQCELVDLDGDRVPMKEAYYVDEETIMCCGSDIKELDNGNLFCEVCGTEYETE